MTARHLPFALLVLAILFIAPHAPAAKKNRAEDVYQRQIDEKQKLLDACNKKIEEQKPIVDEAKTRRNETHQTYNEIVDEQRKTGQAARSTGSKLQVLIDAKQADYERSDEMMGLKKKHETWLKRKNEIQARLLQPLRADPRYKQLESHVAQLRRQHRKFKSQPIQDEAEIQKINQRVVDLEQQITRMREEAFGADPEYLLARDNVKTYGREIHDRRKAFEKQVCETGEASILHSALEKANKKYRNITTKKLPPALSQYRKADQNYRKQAALYDRCNNQKKKYEKEIENLKKAKEQARKQRKKRKRR